MVMNGCSGGFLTTASALIAMQVAQGRTPEELVLLGTFFTTLGDNLALLAASQDLCASAGPDLNGSGPGSAV